MMRKTLITFSLLAVAGGFTSCSSVTGIQVPVLKPSAVNLSAYRLLAVDKFEGPACHQLSQQFALALRNAENPATGKPGFEVMDHTEVERLMERMRGNRTELDPQSKEVLDRWRSVDVVLKGTIRQNEVKERVTVVPSVDDRGRRFVLTKRHARAVVDLELLALDGKDQVIDRVGLQTEIKAETQAVNGKPRRIDHDDLLARAQGQIVRAYLLRVLPRRVYVRVELFKDKELPDLEIGNGLARTGDWQAARQSYERAVDMATGELEKERYKALFNLGVALEFTDQFGPARQTLQDAFRLKQDKMIRNELARLAHREREVQRLREQVEAAPGQ